MTTKLRIPDYVVHKAYKWLKENVFVNPANQVIGRNKDPYIERYMLSRKSMVPLYDIPEIPFGWAGMVNSPVENIYVHRFVRSDEEQPHNHPWDNLTLLINGSYTEAVYSDDGKELLYEETRMPGDIVVRKANSVHAIRKVFGDCVSIFATAPKTADWGFLVNGETIPYGRYEPNSVL